MDTCSPGQHLSTPERQKVREIEDIFSQEMQGSLTGLVFSASQIDLYDYRCKCPDAGKRQDGGHWLFHV